MRIANVMVSDAWGALGPDSIAKGVGGREGAMLRLSREWAKLGHEVTNFVQTREAHRHVEGDGYHEYVPFDMCQAALETLKYDAAVCWESSRILNERTAANVPVRLLHMQVAHVQRPDLEAAEKYCNGVVGLSEWANGFMRTQGLDAQAWFVRPNGVDIADYPIRDGFGDLPDPPFTFTYSSSPDRGLWHLLKLWPVILKAWPGSKLNVAYGVKKWTSQTRWMHNRVGEMAVEIERLINQEGVTDRGKVGAKELAAMQMSSDAWLYPCDTITATETGCITAVEAGAAGTPMLITDCDCLGEEFGHCAEVMPMPFGPAEYLLTLEALMADQEAYGNYAILGRQMAESRDWGRIAPTWIELFESLS